jgi:hypothetical protein
MHFIHNDEYAKEQHMRFLSPQWCTGSSYSRYDIQGRGDGPILLQTPWLCASTCTRLGQTSFRIEEPGESASEAESSWARFMRHAEGTIKAWIETKSEQSPVSWHGATACGCIKLTVHTSEGVYAPTVFDKHRQESSMAELESCQKEGGGDDGSLVRLRFLLHLSHAWHKNAHAGVRWQVLQIQHCRLASIQRCMFDANRPAEVVVGASGVGAGGAGCGSLHAAGPAAPSRKAHPVFGKYFGMVAMGVPPPAVKQKMTMAGLDPSVLDLPDGESLPDCTAESSATTASLISGGQVKLRKTERQERSIVASSGGKGHGISLSDVVNGLSSLRRTLFRGGSRSSGGASDAVTVAAAGKPPAKACQREQTNHMLLELFKERSK